MKVPSVPQRRQGMKFAFAAGEGEELFLLPDGTGFIIAHPDKPVRLVRFLPQGGVEVQELIPWPA